MAASGPWIETWVPAEAQAQTSPWPCSSACSPQVFHRTWAIWARAISLSPPSLSLLLSSSSPYYTIPLAHPSSARLSGAECGLTCLVLHGAGKDPVYKMVSDCLDPEVLGGLLGELPNPWGGAVSPDCETCVLNPGHCISVLHWGKWEKWECWIPWNLRDTRLIKDLCMKYSHYLKTFCKLHLSIPEWLCQFQIRIHM